MSGQSLFAVALLLGSALVLAQSDSICIETPFCSRLTDCCQRHSECFSMCCGANGQCIETKFCYRNSVDRSLLRGAPDDKMLTPAVNSTTQPYGRVHDYKPCFQYASFDKTETTADGRWIVDQNEPYSEP